MIRTDATSRDILAGTLVLTLFCGSAVFFPLFGFIGFLIIPMPVMVYRIKFGRQAGAVIPALSMGIITALTGGGGADTWLMLGMLAEGYLLGECAERDFSAEKAIAFSSGAILLAGCFAIAVIGNISGGGGVALVSDYLRKNLDATAAIYRQLDAPEEHIRILVDSLDQIHYVLIRIMPAMAASGLLIAAWMNLLLGRIALRKVRLDAKAFAKLNTWQAPDRLVWAVIVSALAAMSQPELLKFAGWNLMIVLMIVYMFQGFGVLSFFFERKKAPPLLRIMIYGIIVLQQALVLLVIGIGFFDMWINFRRLGVGSPEQPST